MSSVRELNKSNAEKLEYRGVNEIKTVVDEVSFIVHFSVKFKDVRIVGKSFPLELQESAKMKRPKNNLILFNVRRTNQNVLPYI